MLSDDNEVHVTKSRLPKQFDISFSSKNMPKTNADASEMGGQNVMFPSSQNAFFTFALP